MLLPRTVVRRMAIHFKFRQAGVCNTNAPQARRAWGSVSQEAPVAPRMALRPDADIEHAIRVGSEIAGRQIPDSQLEKLCETLRGNWFSSARDIAAMSEDECVSIGFPLRLKNTIANAILDEVPLPAPSTSPRESDGESSLAGRDADADDMEARVCPPLDRFGFSISDVPKGMSPVLPPPRSLAHSRWFVRSPSRGSEKDQQILPRQV